MTRARLAAVAALLLAGCTTASAPAETVITVAGPHTDGPHDSQLCFTVTHHGPPTARPARLELTATDPAGRNYDVAVTRHTDDACADSGHPIATVTAARLATSPLGLDWPHHTGSFHVAIDGNADPAHHLTLQAVEPR